MRSTKAVKVSSPRRSATKRSLRRFTISGTFFDGIAPINTIRSVRCPTLIVHGADDGIVPVSEARSIHAARSGSHVQLKIVAGSHDDFADLDKQLPDIVDFLSRGIRE